MTGQDKWALVVRLLREPRETEWLEWKADNSNPLEMGQNISALANSCALHGTGHAYIIWGIEDATKRVIGTSFDFEHQREQCQDLEHWLATQLRPRVAFRFDRIEHEGRHVVLLEIYPAAGSPVAFKGIEYIRVGSHTKKLQDHPEYERRLWRAFDARPFEQVTALENLDVADIVSLLDYPSYFKLTGSPLPENRSQIIETLQAAGMVSYEPSTGWSITNLGAVLFAGDMAKFPTLARKALRVIRYRGASRVETLTEQVGQRGYASGFSGMILYIMQSLPGEETLEAGIRRHAGAIPEVAVRELVANALIHQDFFLAGAGPMVEIFDDRVEITNPGSPLIPQERFIDRPPRSRNEGLAGAARLLGLCEERGSGWDKIAFAAEVNQLPAPLIEVADEATRVVLFSARPLDKMDREDRVRAVYLHACLRWVNRQQMTNATVRERFGLPTNRSQTASRFIRDAISAGLIAAYDPTVGPKAMRYVPFWASEMEV